MHVAAFPVSFYLSRFDIMCAAFPLLCPSLVNVSTLLCASKHKELSAFIHRCQTCKIFSCLPRQLANVVCVRQFGGLGLQ